MIVTVKFNELTEHWEWHCGYGCWGYDLPSEAAALREFDRHACRKDS